MKLDENMGLVFIEEQTSPDQNYIKNLDVVDKNGVFYVDFESCLHSFDVMNRNSRMYEGSNIQECLNTERINHYLSHGGWYGEMDHPTSDYKNKDLSPERIKNINMKNTSHRMLNPHIQNNLLVSRIQTDAGTDAGMNLAKKMVQGFIPSYSCRAIACLNLKNGKPVVNVKQIITYDWVLYPSHREANQITEEPTKFVSKVANTVKEFTESVADKVQEGILIPLKEILESVGRTDVNAQVIMESFDLSPKDLVGISNDNKHIIMKDNNNVIYCNINQESRKKINDYLRSF